MNEIDPGGLSMVNVELTKKLLKVDRSLPRGCQ